MIQITDHHAPHLALLRPELVTPAIGAELSEQAEVIAKDAAFSIVDGAISGKGHVPSAPGEPPNADTHDLDQSIHVGELIETTDTVATSIIADSDHALYQELGTSKMEARPFLRPATERQRAATLDAIRGALTGRLR